jgi:hypothetical protein
MDDVTDDVRYVYDEMNGGFSVCNFGRKFRYGKDLDMLNLSVIN